MRYADDFYPREHTTYVILGDGTRESLAMCLRCGKPEITVKQERWLARKKVELGRCRCRNRGVAS